MKRQEWMTLNLLLIPLYTAVLMMLFGNNAGGINWPMLIATFVLCPSGAWLLSKGKNLRSRLVGLLLYIALGAYQAISHFLDSSTNYGPWTFDIYMGIAVIIMGVVVFFARREYR